MWIVSENGNNIVTRCEIERICVAPPLNQLRKPPSVRRRLKRERRKGEKDTRRTIARIRTQRFSASASSFPIVARRSRHECFKISRTISFARRLVSFKFNVASRLGMERDYVNVSPEDNFESRWKSKATRGSFDVQRISKSETPIRRCLPSFTCSGTWGTTSYRWCKLPRRFCVWRRRGSRIAA